MPEFRSGEYLTFRIGRDDLALPASAVRGVLPIHELLSADADEPSVHAGTAMLGGVSFPVLDLRVKLGLRSGTYGRNPSIVVVQTEAGLVGFLTDRVSDIIHARAHDYRAGKLRIGRARRLLDLRTLSL